jgi:hypothetical protein
MWFTRYPDGSYELASLKMCGYRATNQEITDSEAEDFRELEKITSSRNCYDPDKWRESVDDPVHVISAFNPGLSIEFEYYGRKWCLPVVRVESGFVILGSTVSSAQELQRVLLAEISRADCVEHGSFYDLCAEEVGGVLGAVDASTGDGEYRFSVGSLNGVRRAGEPWTVFFEWKYSVLFVDHVVQFKAEGSSLRGLLEASGFLS